jgi:hypothetical protein
MTTLTKAARYTGHGEKTGGLQTHSVGPLYPYIVYSQETPRGRKHGVLHGGTGGDSGPTFDTHAEAERWARALAKSRNAQVAA